MQLEFRYTLSLADFRRALRQHFRSKKYGYYLLALALGLIPLAGGYYLLAAPGLLYLLFLILLWDVIYPYSVWPDLYRRTKFLSDEFEAVADDEGILLIGSDVQAKAGWGAYCGVRETPDFFILYQGPATLTIIPKRFLAAEQQEELGRFLKGLFPAGPTLAG